jgi:hypothetical protein
MMPHDPDDERAAIADIVEETLPEVPSVGPATMEQKTAFACAIAFFILGIVIGQLAHC